MIDQAMIDQAMIDQTMIYQTMIYQAMIIKCRNGVSGVSPVQSAKTSGLHSYFPLASCGVRASAEVTILSMKARDIIRVKR